MSSPTALSTSTDQELSDLLGIPFVPSERLQEQFDKIGIPCKGIDRASLKQSNPKAYEKVKDTACAPIKDKFSLMKTVDEKSSLADFQSIYSIDTRLRVLKKSLKASDLLDVFTTFTKWETTVRPGRSKVLPSTAAEFNSCLLDKFNITTLDNVKKSSEFWMLSGGDHHVENVRWSGEKILDSCDEPLREKILESTHSLPQIFHGGPVYFFYMMSYVTTTSDQAMRCVVDKLHKLRLTDFDGEDVRRAVTFIRGAHQLLANNGAVPHDMNTSVFNMMRVCSTPAFVSFVTNLETAYDLDVVTDTSIEFLLTKLEQKYTQLLGSNQWLSKVTPAGSSFQANGSSDADDSICFNCGGLGHKSPQCPLPHNAANIKRYQSIVGKLKSQSSPEPKGGGDDTAEKKKRRERGGSGKKEKDKPPIDPFRLCPKAGEPHSKTFPGIGERHWCGRCCCWTDHGTANHPDLPATAAGAAGGTHDSSLDDDASTTSTPVLPTGAQANLVDADGYQLVTPKRGTTFAAALMNASNF